MSQEKEKSSSKEEARKLRKKIKRIEESRSTAKLKNRDKGKAIKTYQDRQRELKENRDDWKVKYKEQEKKNKELSKELKELANQLEMTEGDLQEIRDEFNEVKKKSHKGFGKPL